MEINPEVFHMARSSGKGSKNSNIIAALAYLLGIISGIVVYLVKKDDSFARFHAVQSIFFSLSIVVINIVLGITVIGAILIPIVGLVALILWLVLMYKALMGERYHLPVIGEWAEKYA